MSDELQPVDVNVGVVGLSDEGEVDDVRETAALVFNDVVDHAPMVGHVAAVDDTLATVTGDERKALDRGREPS